MTTKNHKSDRGKNLPAGIIQRWFPWVVLFVLWVSILLIAPVGKKVIFDSREGLVAMNGFIYQSGITVISGFHGEKLSLFTTILGAWYRWMTVGLWSGRILVWVFSGILLFTFYRVVSVRSNRYGGLIAVFLLYSSVNFLPLSISLTESIPAWALAMSSAAALGLPRKVRSRSCLLVSSCLMILSMSISFSTAVIVPAILAELIFADRTYTRRQKIVEAAILSGGLILSFTIISMIWKIDFPTVFPTAASSRESKGAHELLMQFASELPALVLVAAGCCSGFRVFLRASILPLVWLVAALTLLPMFISSGLHPEFFIAMPFCWLAGVAAATWCESESTGNPGNSNAHRTKIGIVALLVILAIPGRMISVASQLKDPVYAMDERIIRAIQHERGLGAKITATFRHQAYLVECGLISVSSGVHTERMILDIKMRSPDIVLVDRSDVDVPLALAMKEKYFPTSVTDGVMLFKKKTESGTNPGWAEFTHRTALTSPFDWVAQIDLAKLCITEGRDAEAAARYQLVLRRTDARPEWIMDAAMLLASTGNNQVKNCEEAIGLADYAMQKSAGRPDVVELREKIFLLCPGETQP